jgi:hypothetical protein
MAFRITLLHVRRLVIVQDGVRGLRHRPTTPIPYLQPSDMRCAGDAPHDARTGTDLEMCGTGTPPRHTPRYRARRR